MHEQISAPGQQSKIIKPDTEHYAYLDLELLLKNYSGGSLTDIPPAAAISAYSYMANQYLSDGLETLKASIRPSGAGDLFVLEESYFPNICALLTVIQVLIIRGNASILIISDRKIKDGMTDFFISKQAGLREWRRKLKGNNATSIGKLLRYYSELRSGGLLTKREYDVLRAAYTSPSRGGVERLLSMSNKQVSHYYLRIKDKLGINNKLAMLNYIGWLFP
ncbi:hypothetical protein [Raoultella terrigena]|uniref:hypothetical protein n=1 Tax=Raoultella terrigena TaxID=577 RepID=UPI00384ACE3F